MIADSWRAKLRNEPFGAGSETTSGLAGRDRVLAGRGASTDFRRAVSSVSERKARAWTATRDPRIGFAAFAQKLLRAVRVLGGNAFLAAWPGAAISAETVAAVTAKAASPKPGRASHACLAAGGLIVVSAQQLFPLRLFPDFLECRAVGAVLKTPRRSKWRLRTTGPSPSAT